MNELKQSSGIERVSSRKDKIARILTTCGVAILFVLFVFTVIGCRLLTVE